MSTTEAEKEPEWLEKDLFDDMCEGLLEFQREHGHLDVPLDYQYHDEYLAIWLDQQRKQERLKSKGRRLPQDKIDRLTAIGVDFENGNALPVVVEPPPPAAAAAKKDDVDESEEDEEPDEHWNHMFKGLIELQKTLGHLEVPKGCEFFGVSLYDWAREQRERYKDNRRRNVWRTKINRLRELGFDLAPNEKRKSSSGNGGVNPMPKTHADIEQHWKFMLEGLKEFRQLTGNFDVPPGCDYHGFSLYDWTRKQKNRYRKVMEGEQTALLPARRKCLDAIGFHEAIGAAAPATDSASRVGDNEKWEAHFQVLVDFKNEHGHINVPTNYEVDGRNIYSWLDYQRRTLCCKRARQSNLSQERLKRLTDLGLHHFSMSLQEARWHMMFEALADFKAKHGHFKVPSAYLVDSRFLSKWITKQRAYYQNRVENKKLALSDERLELLNSIGFEFIPVIRRKSYNEAGEEGGDEAGDSFDMSGDESDADASNDDGTPSLKKRKLSD